MNTQSIDISLYQKGDIALEDIYKKFKNCFMRYAGKVLSSEFYAEDGYFSRQIILYLRLQP